MISKYRHNFWTKRFEENPQSPQKPNDTSISIHKPGMWQLAW